MVQLISPAHKCLALDIGGVICSDTWETIFLTPKIGLAAHYGLDPEWVFKKGEELWDAYAYSSHAEEHYWQTWEIILDRHIDRQLIADIVKKCVWVDETACALVEDCLSSGIQVALVSNSTSFWFLMQMRLSKLEKVQDKLKLYLSHEIGYSKTHEKGGLSQLAAAIKPETVLFVDDRFESIRAAKKLGLTGFLYSRDSHINLARTLGV